MVREAQEALLFQLQECDFKAKPQGMLALTTDRAKKLATAVAESDTDLRDRYPAVHQWGSGATDSRGVTSMYFEDGKPMWTPACDFSSMVEGKELVCIPIVFLLVFAVNKVMQLDAGVAATGGRRAATLRRVEAVLLPIDNELRTLFPSIFAPDGGAGGGVTHRSPLYVFVDIIPRWDHARAIIVRGSRQRQRAYVPAGATSNAVELVRKIISTTVPSGEKGGVIVMSALGADLVERVLNEPATQQ